MDARASQPNLKRAALLGWIVGLASALLFQCLWPSSFQNVTGRFCQSHPAAVVGPPQSGKFLAVK